jgi:hypothetical protein
MCAQQPNEICIDRYRIPLAYYHAERIEDAAALSGGEGDPPSREEFRKAVEDSDLV